MEDFTGNTSKLGDWLIYQGRKKFVEVFRGMLSRFYACRSLHRLSRQSPDRTDTRNRELSTCVNRVYLLNQISLVLGVK